MYILELKQDKINNCIMNNEIVIVCFYEKNSLISDLMIGTMNVLKNKLNNNTIIIISNKINDINNNEHNYPKVEIYKKQKKVHTLNGFFSYKKLIKYLS